MTGVLQDLLRAWQHGLGEGGEVTLLEGGQGGEGGEGGEGGDVSA